LERNDLGPHAAAGYSASRALRTRRSRTDSPLAEELAGQVHEAAPPSERLRCLHRCHWTPRWSSLPVGVENHLQSLFRRTRRAAHAQPTTGLLLVDYRRFGRCPSCFRAKATG